MRDLIVIKQQSFSDLITNSSSELFQLRTDQTVEQVNEALSQFTTGFMYPVLFTLENYKKNKNKWKGLIEAIYPGRDATNEEWITYWTKRDEMEAENPELAVYNCAGEWYFDKSNLKSVEHIYREYLCNYDDWYDEDEDDLQNEFKDFVLDNHYLIDENRYYPYSTYNLKNGAVKAFIDSHEMPDPLTLIDKYGYYIDTIESLDGCIIVLSKSDNSIPYEDFEKINEMFNGNNYHLG